jgi:hypothetical protein
MFEIGLCMCLEHATAALARLYNHPYLPSYYIGRNATGTPLKAVFELVYVSQRVSRTDEFFHRPPHRQKIPFTEHDLSPASCL